MKPQTSADAEADLRAAIDDGDQARIEQAGAAVDHLDTRPTPSLHSAALWYAEHGLPVFPLSPGSKIPLKGSGGCKDATTDPAMVNQWWTGNPRLNIGLATGVLVDAVDIDGPAGQQSRAQHWDDIFARIDGDALAKVLTPRRGGMHLYVPTTGDGNAAGIVPGVDYRGAGGYVVAPPSVIVENGKDHPGTYRFLGTPRLAELKVGAA